MKIKGESLSRFPTVSDYTKPPSEQETKALEKFTNCKPWKNHPFEVDGSISIEGIQSRETVAFQDMPPNRGKLGRMIGSTKKPGAEDFERMHFFFGRFAFGQLFLVDQNRKLWIQVHDRHKEPRPSDPDLLLHILMYIICKV